jgi:hypothetical protein
METTQIAEISVKEDLKMIQMVEASNAMIVGKHIFPYLH